MYHPYFRGKQFDLLTVKESAPVLAAASFRPIIEPVRDSLSGLGRALDAVVESKGNAIVVVNPEHGDMSTSGEPISKLLEKDYLNMPHISAGILLTADTTLKEAVACHEEHSKHDRVFIHNGFTDAKGLAEALGDLSKDDWHIFVDSPGSKLYRKHFRSASRVLLRDGFDRKKNKDYPKLESFSDLHATFEEEGVDGFGDFLIVGDEYMESGGLPLVLAIHITFIDHDQDDMMMIYHFKSKLHATQKDPAGKFAEALDQMMATLNQPNSNVHETSAIQEFRYLHEKKHFPGLGYIKKLSMKHHIETLAEYFKDTE